MKKVIDVSSYQGTINWRKVSSSGVDGAILKIIRKDLAPDKQFERNWTGCENTGLPVVGVYNYSYATTESKARKDAQAVIDTLAGRKAKVWLDVEDKAQKGLGIGLIRMIKAYQEVIEAAGLDFGVYTGLAFYNAYIRPWSGYLDCNFWVARYPYTKPVSLTYEPSDSKIPLVSHTLEGWQYSSKASVPGISGSVDINQWYGAISSGQKSEITFPIPERILKLKAPKMQGSDVKWVQYHLIRLGFLSENNDKGRTNLDGIYGKATAAAVKAAQKHYGIKVDGIVGGDTAYVLRWN